jgi:hypothetical protein
LDDFPEQDKSDSWIDVQKFLTHIDENIGEIELQLQKYKYSKSH